jgi:type I restriction enzyme S subunit
MRSNYRRIEDFIQLVDERNKDLKIDRLLGLSITKEFIPSVANTVGANMKNYKIIRKNQFACSIMQVRRDKKMPVAILKDYDEAIISQAYPVFRVVDETKLLPDYLMMWMRREEFDREACFLAVGGVRGSLEWEDFLNMELPVPPIEKQREIVAEYNTVVDRIELNEQINQKLEETAKAIYRYWFEEFEFPISKEYAESIGKPELEGKPYKSSDGEMVYNQELEEEIPKGWERISIQDLIDRNLIHPNRDGNHGELHPKSSDYVDQGIPFIMANDIVNSAIDFENCKFIPKEISDNLRIPPSKKGDVLITHKGTMGRVTIVPEIDIPIVLTPQVTFYRVKQKKKITKEFLYWLNPLNTGQCFC